MNSIKLTTKGSGFALRYGDVKFCLDTSERGATTLLSHAHADHTGTLDKAIRVIATNGTIDTLKARGGTPTWEHVPIEYGDSLMTSGVKISCLNAGHVLGSSMFLITFRDGLRVLYTGDFNVVDSIVHKAAQSVDVDVLITEATYGIPRWAFPDRLETHEKIVNQADKVIVSGGIPLFRAYSLGKAQEAIALLQNNGMEVVSGNWSIDEVCRVYNEHGAGLEHVSMRSGNIRELLEKGCAIVSAHPDHTMRNLEKKVGSTFVKRLRNRISEYNLSGWTLEKAGTGFPLSAHSDFNGLIEFAKEVNPRVAYCFTGHATKFAGYLAEEGINAVPLE